MLGNPKNVFWEALFLTVVLFFFGLLVGVAFEGKRIDRVEDFYASSEILLMDVLALNNLVNSDGVNCQAIIDANLEFADRVYEEAQILEDYGSSERLTQNALLAHKRYDLLRTFLWVNSMKTFEKCEEKFSTVVYLFEREAEDLTQRATQNVWGKIIFDLKQEKGDEIILIPIAVDSGLSSLKPVLRDYDIKSYPVVIINDNIITELSSVDQLKVYL